MKKKGYIFVALLLVSYFHPKAQELNCLVTIDTKALVTDQASERNIFKDMERDISSFINNRVWTEDRFEEEEKIQCKLDITLTKMPTQGIFEGTAVITSFRPIYHTNQETKVFQYVDRNFNFQYLPAQQVVFSDNNYNGELSSILAFYVYMILTMDYDSFSNLGGEEFAEKAFNVVNVAQQTGGGGWKRNQDKRNRYWLAENIMSQQMIPFREAVYLYHRQGLDMLLYEKKGATEKIYEAMEKIADANKIKGPAILFNTFLEVKAQEIVYRLIDAELETRQKLRNILVRLDPQQTSIYNQLIQKK